jgi:PleD family two-component response regulator
MTFRDKVRIDRRVLPAVTAGAFGLTAGIAAAALGSVGLAVLAGCTSLAVAAMAVRAIRDTDAVEQRVHALEELAGAVRRSLEATAGTEEAVRQAAAQDTEQAGTNFLIEVESGLRGEAYFRASFEDRMATARRHLRPITLVLCEMVPATSAGREMQPEDAPIVARALERTLRDSDLACRLDDGRFVLLLDDTPDTSAVWAMERLRNQMQMELPLRVRAGIASYPTHGLTSHEVLDHATRALAEAGSTHHDGIQVARTGD